ncbi:hypothetical protein PVAND_002767 [Polypedilum vanderplanki]|uniref:Uncharacterized protein n=1 Tax=Polypedilum vanderplanki TaxID=319348 RepID=A0A9J6BS50_POLVA|nr:hypothetical protein PVAND_002767 [Polypedilum vanderplanki]
MDIFKSTLTFLAKEGSEKKKDEDKSIQYLHTSKEDILIGGNPTNNVRITGTESTVCRIYVNSLQKIGIENVSNNKQTITVNESVITKKGLLKSGDIIEVMGTKMRWESNADLKRRTAHMTKSARKEYKHKYIKSNKRITIHSCKSLTTDFSEPKIIKTKEEKTIPSTSDIFEEERIVKKEDSSFKNSDVSLKSSSEETETSTALATEPVSPTSSTLNKENFKTPVKVVNLNLSGTLQTSYTPQLKIGTRSVLNSPYSAKNVSSPAVAKDILKDSPLKSNSKTPLSVSKKSMHLIDFVTTNVHKVSSTPKVVSVKKTPKTVGKTPVRSDQILLKSALKNSSIKKNLQTPNVMQSSSKGRQNLFPEEEDSSTNTSSVIEVSISSVEEIEINSDSAMENSVITVRDTLSVGSSNVYSQNTEVQTSDDEVKNLMKSIDNALDNNRLSLKADSEEWRGLEGNLNQSNKSLGSSIFDHVSINNVSALENKFDEIFKSEELNSTNNTEQNTDKETPDVLKKGEDMIKWIENAKEAIQTEPNKTTQVLSSRYSNITPNDSLVDTSVTTNVYDVKTPKLSILGTIDALQKSDIDNKLAKSPVSRLSIANNSTEVVENYKISSDKSLRSTRKRIGSAIASVLNSSTTADTTIDMNESINLSIQQEGNVSHVETSDILSLDDQPVQKPEIPTTLEDTESRLDSSNSMNYLQFASHDADDANKEVFELCNVEIESKDQQIEDESESEDDESEKYSSEEEKEQYEEPIDENDNQNGHSESKTNIHFRLSKEDLEEEGIQPLDISKNEDELQASLEHIEIPATQAFETSKSDISFNEPIDEENSLEMSQEEVKDNKEHSENDIALENNENDENIEPKDIDHQLENDVLDKFEHENVDDLQEKHEISALIDSDSVEVKQDEILSDNKDSSEEKIILDDEIVEEQNQLQEEEHKIIESNNEQAVEEVQEKEEFNMSEKHEITENDTVESLDTEDEKDDIEPVECVEEISKDELKSSVQETDMNESINSSIKHDDVQILQQPEISEEVQDKNFILDSSKTVDNVQLTSQNDIKKEVFELSKDEQQQEESFGADENDNGEENETISLTLNKEETHPVNISKTEDELKSLPEHIEIPETQQFEISIHNINDLEDSDQLYNESVTENSLEMSQEEVKDNKEHSENDVALENNENGENIEPKDIDHQLENDVLDKFEHENVDDLQEKHEISALIDSDSVEVKQDEILSDDKDSSEEKKTLDDEIVEEQNQLQEEEHKIIESNNEQAVEEVQEKEDFNMSEVQEITVNDTVESLDTENEKDKIETSMNVINANLDIENRKEETTENSTDKIQDKNEFQTIPATQEIDSNDVSETLDVNVNPKEESTEERAIEKIQDKHETESIRDTNEDVTEIMNPPNDENAELQIQPQEEKETIEENSTIESIEEHIVEEIHEKVEIKSLTTTHEMIENIAVEKLNDVNEKKEEHTKENHENVKEESDLKLSLQEKNVSDVVKFSDEKNKTQITPSVKVIEQERFEQLLIKESDTNKKSDETSLNKGKIEEGNSESSIEAEHESKSLEIEATPVSKRKGHKEIIVEEKSEVTPSTKRRARIEIVIEQKTESTPTRRARNMKKDQVDKKEDKTHTRFEEENDEKEPISKRGKRAVSEKSESTPVLKKIKNLRGKKNETQTIESKIEEDKKVEETPIKKSKARKHKIEEESVEQKVESDETSPKRSRREVSKEVKQKSEPVQKTGRSRKIQEPIATETKTEPLEMPKETVQSQSKRGRAKKIQEETIDEIPIKSIKDNESEESHAKRGRAKKIQEKTIDETPIKITKDSECEEIYPKRRRAKKIQEPSVDETPLKVSNQTVESEKIVSKRGRGRKLQETIVIESETSNETIDESEKPVQKRSRSNKVQETEIVVKKRDESEKPAQKRSRGKKIQEPIDIPDENEQSQPKQGRIKKIQKPSVTETKESEKSQSKRGRDKKVQETSTEMPVEIVDESEKPAQKRGRGKKIQETIAIETSNDIPKESERPKRGGAKKVKETEKESEASATVEEPQVIKKGRGARTKKEKSTVEEEKKITEEVVETKRRDKTPLEKVSKHVTIVTPSQVEKLRKKPIEEPTSSSALSIEKENKPKRAAKRTLKVAEETETPVSKRPTRARK